MAALDKCVDFIEKFWGKPRSFPFVYLLIGCICFKICVLQDASNQFLLNPRMRWVVFAFGVIVAATYTICCIIKNKLPKAPKGKLAVLFVVDAETLKGFKAVENKLIKSFRELVQANTDADIEIVACCIPRERVVKYNLQKKEDAIELLERTRCLFLVDVKYLVDDYENTENFEMRINCGVVHPYFNETIEQALNRDLTRLGNSVRQQNFAKETLLPVFRFTAQTLSFTCQYIFGFVCLFCGSTNEALRIYETLRSKLRNEPPSDIVKLLNVLVPVRLHAAYIDIAETKIASFQSSKELAYLRLAKKALEQADSFVPDSYAYNLDMAYVAIALDRDFALAKECIEKCKKHKNEKSWRYSDAFLCAYKGHSGQTIMSKYAAAFNTQYPAVLDITDFIEFILEREPERKELHLAVGLIYENMGDARLMKKHFSEYISHLDNCNQKIVTTLKKKIEDNPCEYDCGHECQKCSEQTFG